MAFNFYRSRFKRRLKRMAKIRRAKAKARARIRRRKLMRLMRLRRIGYRM